MQQQMVIKIEKNIQEHKWRWLVENGWDVVVYSRFKLNEPNGYASKEFESKREFYNYFRTFCLKEIATYSSFKEELL